MNRPTPKSTLSAYTVAAAMALGVAATRAQADDTCLECAPAITPTIINSTASADGGKSKSTSTAGAVSGSTAGASASSDQTQKTTVDTQTNTAVDSKNTNTVTNAATGGTSTNNNAATGGTTSSTNTNANNNAATGGTATGGNSTSTGGTATGGTSNASNTMTSSGNSASTSTNANNIKVGGATATTGASTSSATTGASTATTGASTATTGASTSSATGNGAGNTTTTTIKEGDTKYVVPVQAASVYAANVPSIAGTTLCIDQDARSYGGASLGISTGDRSYGLSVNFGGKNNVNTNIECLKEKNGLDLAVKAQDGLNQKANIEASSTGAKQIEIVRGDTQIDALAFQNGTCVQRTDAWAARHADIVREAGNGNYAAGLATFRQACNDANAPVATAVAAPAPATYAARPKAATSVGKKLKLANRGPSCNIK